MTSTQRTSENTPGFDATIPTTFTSLQEASNSLDFLLNGCVKCAYEAETARVSQTVQTSQVVYFLHMLQAWDDAFQGFLDKHHLTPRHMQRARVLQVGQTYFALSVHATGDNGEFSETAFDEHPSLYRRLLNIAADIVAAEAAERNCSPRYAFEWNIVAPLYGLAQHCRDPFARREAVALLKACRRREGVWDSATAAIIAEKVIAIDEEGLGLVTHASQVPSGARINAVHVEFDAEGKVSNISYTRCRNPEQKEQLPLNTFTS